MEVAYGRLVLSNLRECGIGRDVSATVCQFLPPRWEISSDINNDKTRLIDPSTGREIFLPWFKPTLLRPKRKAVIRALADCDEMFKGFKDIKGYEVLDLTINIPIMQFHADDMILDVLPFCAAIHMKDNNGFYGQKHQTVIRHIEVGLYGQDSRRLIWHPIFFIPKPERDKIIKAVMAQLPDYYVALVGW